MQSSHVTSTGSHVPSEATSSEYYYHGGCLYEAVVSYNGGGSSGITEYSPKQRAGAQQRNPAQNCLTGEKKSLSYSIQCTKL